MKILFGTASLLLVSICFIRPVFSEEIKLSSTGGVYTVPVRLNDLLTVDFLIDTGAADVGLSDELAARLQSTGVMTERDFRGSERYTLADGSFVTCRLLVLRAVRIGAREVPDVKASACPGNAPLLLGQSFLKKLGPWALDYGRNVLLVMSDAKKAFEPPAYAPKDVEWHQAAGAQGDAAAQFNLAVMFEKGDGVPRNSAKAVELLEKSAAQGYAPAQSGLASLYEAGDRVKKSASKAFDLYRKAAEQGLAEAQNNLAGMYRSGEGVPRDIGKAMEWYQKAAGHGDDPARINLGLMYELGDGVPKDPARAVEWYRRSAEDGGMLGQYYLGMAYLKGDALPRDPAKAIGWLQKAAARGLAEAQYGLGLIYHYGEDAPKDEVLASAWIRLAAANGKANAAADLELVEKPLTPAERAEAESLASGWKAGQVLKRSGK
jgi:clan AA aspartic protease (TIGR02281 family)